jgi:arginase family enzyme
MDGRNRDAIHLGAFGSSSQFGNMLSCGSWVRAAKLSNPNLEKVVMFGVADELATEADEPYVTCIRESEINGLSPYDLEDYISTIDVGRNIYLSIDKDVMSKKFAATNWDQGTMSLLQLEAIVNKILDGRRLLGVDICGELSESKGGSAEESLLNVRTNLELQTFFEKRLIDSSFDY